MVIKGLRGVSLLVFFNLTVLAQMPVLTLEHLTTKEGLPSNDVWCLNQDKKGFLWIGTGRNICRYDGYSFLRLDSLQLGYCSGIGTDSKGDLYTSVDTRGLCKIDVKTMKVRTVAFNNYDDRDPSNDLHEQSMVDSHDQVWVCDYTSVKRYNPKTHTLHRYIFKQLASGGDVYQYASFFEDKSRTLWIVSEIGLFRYDRRRDKLVCVLGQEAELVKNRIQVRLCKASEDSKGDLWIGGYEYGLVHFSPKDGSFNIRKPGFEHNNVLCAQESLDENGRKLLFVGTSDGVSLLYPQTGALYHLPEFYNTGVQVKDMFDDRVNGILWIGTNEGVYKYRYRNAGITTAAIPADIVRLPVQVTTIQAIPDDRRDAGRYLLGLSHSGVMEWKPSTHHFRLMRFPHNALTQQLRWINGRAYAFTDKGLFEGDFEKGIFKAWEPGTRFFSNQDFRDGLMDKKGRLWIGNLNEGLKVIDPKTNKELKLWPPDEVRQLVEQSYIKGMVEGLDGRIWIATCSRGLFYFDENKRKFINIGMLPINRNKKLILGGACINGIQLTTEGNVLIASWGGVAKVSAAGEVLHVVSFKTDPLKDTYCANLAETPDGNLWFSTNEGIHIADLKTNSLRYITTIEGLRSNSPVGFFHDGKNTLLLGQTNMLNILNISQLSSNVNLPRILLSTAEVKGTVRHQDFSKEMVLKPDENAVTFNFTTLGFEPMSQNHYSYRLEGFEKQWVDIGNLNSVSFTNLREGSYVLNVVSRNSSGMKSPRPLAVHFTIEPHFTNTWFFRILIGLSIAGLIVGMMRWRVSTLDERNKLDLQIAEWRLKALQSQMNPHFLFNSMNSVQNYLLTNRGVEGAKYLSKFSKLVRRIMENSNHQYLPFEKIIETLKMYVEIESFRFNHEFSYVFDIEENEALLDVLLPPMLLQPYIENAIWHGLMPKEGEKKLTITARLQNRHIVCTIEDNGVGRNFSPRTEGHISRGQEMTKGIFESLRRKDSEAKLELVDLFDENQKAAGTRVIMIIPIDNV
ncbi:two-component regulator propeller domain-containing protein [Dyadobacter sp. CY323]|uniref:two-component regulator propeller domain-containing protein n=1 Tax=Dyadobacter sp. CY323 TaxID=2907302 RepID=UPI001F43729C|nr:two-component regulator propeller domain-containing protein [Dyadobacter sp. CY323]MCE6991481.1 histidine kinase [Dyadobacter sp. CY323]